MSKKITFNCAECGKEKTDWAYRKPRFCSAKCAFRFASKLPKPWQSNRVSLICSRCKKEYSIGAAFHKLRGSKFCSTKCKYEAKSISMRGANNPNYVHGVKKYDRGPNWLSQARKARKRDSYTCQVCKKNGKIDQIRIDVHHIKPYRKFSGDYENANQLGNLISLCNPCHRKVEWGKVLLPGNNI